MNSELSPLDAYFAGKTTPAEEQSLAILLSTDPSLADEFVAQAQLDALLGEIFRDHKSGAVHASLTAMLAPPDVTPAVTQPTKIVRGPFPYWKQVAAMLVAGLLLWGLVGVWYGAAQISGGPRRFAKPNVETVVATTGGPNAKQASEDRELETWLRNYYVDAQPAATLTLEAWLALLVEHEFPLHNHLHKHRGLRWEIRTKDPREAEQLAQQTLPLQCAPASLLTQVQGVAALAGCEVTVETDKLVLTPIPASSTGVEIKQIALTGAFLRAPVGPTQARDLSHDLTYDFLQTTWTDELSNPSEAIQMQILRTGIQWPEGTQVAKLETISPQTSDVSFMLPTENRFIIPNFDILTDRLVDMNQDSGLVVAASSYQATVTSSPKCLRQLEILASLMRAEATPVNLQITEYVFPAGNIPVEQDRVLNETELAAVQADWKKTTTRASSVTIHQSRPELPSDQASENVSAGFMGYFVPKQAVTFTDDGLEELVDRPDSTVGVSETLETAAPVGEAHLTLTRSGELMKITGAINQPPPPQMATARDLSTYFGTYQNLNTRMDLTENLGRIPNTLSLERNPSPGVDISLALFPGQGAIVAGTAGTYYLLKVAK